jgi:hypothetical protein
MSTTFERDAVGAGTAAPLEVLSRPAGEARVQSDAAIAVPGAENNRIVVLVAPEFLIAAADVELVRTTLQSAGGDARLLARVRCPAGLGVASDLIAAGLPIAARWRIANGACRVGSCHAARQHGRGVE